MERTRARYNPRDMSEPPATPNAPLRMRSPLALARLAADRATMRVLAWQRWRNGARVAPETISATERIPFRCNVCGTGNGSTLDGLTREAITCSHCGSTVRFRALVHLVVSECTGRATPLSSLAPRRDIAGLGLSDEWSYASRLAAKFDYVDTYFHTEPRLDITNVGPEHTGRYDFITSSDVFEHVAPPVGRAFANARRMLKPHGKLILTVPYSEAADTVEHYPDLHDFAVERIDGRFVLRNTTRDGVAQTFTDPVFHGGPGSTLEMRVFSRAALLRDLAAAGFTRVRIANEPHLPFGIHWSAGSSAPIVASP